MPRRDLVPVWFGIIVLSGMFLMGQESWPPPQSDCTDNDGDGYGSPSSSSCEYWGLDCDDTNPNINPGVIEAPYGEPICRDKVDNDCDGFVDDLPGGCSLWEMEQIPYGCYQMGDSFSQGQADELPVHNVCISAFEMDVHEVTNAEYADCVGTGVCTPPSQTDSYTRTSYYGNPDYDDYPVIWVTWNQAQNYCRWAGKRLPTEAEWEYAARGGYPGERYPWGESINCSNANYGRGSPASPCWNEGGLENDTSLPKKFPPYYGLYDMAGNVWEWVNDTYDENYYQYCVDHGITNDPPGADTGRENVLRGGSCISLETMLRVASRYSHDGATYANNSVGFRCARSLP
jgi:formylglycine-generating enzyme required for sulfatase activity